MKHPHILTVTLAAALLLAGCTSMPKINALEHQAAAEDQLPGGVTVWPEEDAER